MRSRERANQESWGRAEVENEALRGQRSSSTPWEKKKKIVQRLRPHYYLPLHAWCHPANPEEYTLAVGHTYGPRKHICTSFCPLTNSEVSFIIPLPLIEIAMQIPFIKCDMDNFSMLHGDTIIFRAHGAGCKVSSDIQMACLFNCSKCSMSGQFGRGHGVHSWTF